MLDNFKNNNESYQTTESTETTEPTEEEATTTTVNAAQQEFVKDTIERTGAKNKTLNSCDERDDLEDVCKNYEGCCESGKYNGNTAFCKHKITTSCKKIYNECKTMLKELMGYIMDDEQVDNVCNTSLENCCNNYIELEKESTYRPLRKGEVIIEGTEIHSFMGPKSNLDTKCEKWCDTQENCKAFIQDRRFGCYFFENLNVADISSVPMGGPRIKSVRGKDIGAEGVNLNLIKIKE